MCEIIEPKKSLTIFGGEGGSDGGSVDFAFGEDVFNSSYSRTVHGNLTGISDDEGALFDLFLALSTTAYQGFLLAPYAAQMADVILMKAQR